MSSTSVAGDSGCDWIQVDGDADSGCDWTQVGDDADLEGYQQIPDPLAYRIKSAASRVVGVGTLVQIGTSAAQVKTCLKGIVAGAAWIRAEVECIGRKLGNLVGPPVYRIVFTIGECVYQITLRALEILCDGACWAGVTVGELIRQYGTKVVIKCCRLSGCLVFMTIEFGGHIVVRIAQLGCHTLLNV